MLISRFFEVITCPLKRGKSIFILLFFLAFKPFLNSLNHYKKNLSDRREKSKIILIGLDGAEWNIINKLIAQDKLPNLKRLIEEGASGNLKSINPMISPALWVSIVTGKHREKHGIMDFFAKAPGQYELDPVCSTQRKTKTLWNIFSENNRNVGIINWWASYPAEKVKGCIISNYISLLPVLPSYINQKHLFASIKEKPITYPGELVDDIMTVGRVSEMDMRLELTRLFLMPLSYLDHSKKDVFFDVFTKGVQTEMGLCRIGKYILQKYSPDLFAIYFWALDGVQHIFWDCMEPGEDYSFKANKEDIEKYGQVIYNTYQAYDEFIGDLLKDIDENTTVIIISDHGFGPLYTNERNYNLNFIFEKLGWLTYRTNEPKEPDWTKTKVYDYSVFRTWATRRNHIYINLRGRDPQGIVPRGKYESFRKEIKSWLEKVETIDGQPVIEKIEIPKKVKVSQGVQPPDLIVQVKHTVNYNQKIKIEGKIYTIDKKDILPIFMGAHRENGIIIMSGKNIKKGAKVEGATILDITPTILALAGLPIGKGMDGEALTGIIKEDFLQKRPFRYVNSYEIGWRRTNPSKDLLIEEFRKQLKNRLKSLGYIQ